MKTSKIMEIHKNLFAGFILMNGGTSVSKISFMTHGRIGKAWAAKMKMIAKVNRIQDCVILLLAGTVRET